MVDLAGQYQKIKSEVDQNIIEVVESSAFINGPSVHAFSRNLEEFLEVGHVIPCANGTDALQMALMALDLQPGDEVITANFTFAATVEVIGLLNLAPVLVDVHPDYFTIDPEAIEKAITPRTKCIIPVHLYGQCAPMEEIMAIAEKYDLPVVEDTAQAIGSECLVGGEWMKAGTIGDIGTTSFFPSKNLGCYGDGGALFTNNVHLAEKLKAIANHGMTKRYYHDEIGVNSRLDSIQAAILDIKLPHLNDYNASRFAAAQAYNEGFKDVKELTTPAFAPYSKHVFHQYTLKVNNGKRDELVAFLQGKEIPAMIYYPVPLHRQKAYEVDGVLDSDFPVTMTLIDQVVSLPMHTELKPDQLQYIINSVKEFFA